MRLLTNSGLTSIAGIVTSKNDDCFVAPRPSRIFAMPPTNVSGIFLIVRMPDLIGLTMVSIWLGRESG